MVKSSHEAMIIMVNLVMKTGRMEACLTKVEIPGGEAVVKVACGEKKSIRLL